MGYSTGYHIINTPFKIQVQYRITQQPLGFICVIMQAFQKHFKVKVLPSGKKREKIMYLKFIVFRKENSIPPAFQYIVFAFTFNILASVYIRCYNKLLSLKFYTDFICFISYREGKYIYFLIGI